MRKRGSPPLTVSLLLHDKTTPVLVPDLWSLKFPLVFLLFHCHLPGILWYRKGSLYINFLNLCFPSSSKVIAFWWQDGCKIHILLLRCNSFLYKTSRCYIPVIRDYSTNDIASGIPLKDDRSDPRAIIQGIILNIKYQWIDHYDTSSWLCSGNDIVLQIFW